MAARVGITVLGGGARGLKTGSKNSIVEDRPGRPVQTVAAVPGIVHVFVRATTPLGDPVGASPPSYGRLATTWAA